MALAGPVAVHEYGNSDCVKSLRDVDPVSSRFANRDASM